MDFLTIIKTLENTNKLTRRIVNTNDGETISYKANTSTNVTINSNTTLEDIIQLYFKTKDNLVYLYINYATRRNNQEYKLEDISSITIT